MTVDPAMQEIDLTKAICPTCERSLFDRASEDLRTKGRPETTFKDGRFYCSTECSEVRNDE